MDKTYKILSIEDQYEDLNLSIEDLWNTCQQTQQVMINDNQKEMIEIDNNFDNIQSVNGYTPINKLFRHRVKKNRWKIGIKNKEALYITEDHSIMVYRNNEVIECKPSEILPTDYLIVKNKEN